MNNKKTKEQIVHNILAKYAQKKGLVKYEYPDGFYVFGNPNSHDMADKKHDEWVERIKKSSPYMEREEDINKYE